MIRFDQVSKIYNAGKPNETVAVRDVTMTVEKGEIVILKGASGSGKSTLLSLLSVLTKPTAGVVSVEDQQVSKLPEHFAAAYRQKRIGMIFQQFNLIPELSVWENVVVPLIPVKKKQLKYAGIENLITQFEMNDKRTQPVKSLSGGEQQRVAIVRALANDPDIVVADEPTANLDADLVDGFIDIIREIHGQGKTIIIATHDERLMQLSDDIRIIEMNNGSISPCS